MKPNILAGDERGAHSGDVHGVCVHGKHAVPGLGRAGTDDQAAGP